MQYLLGIDVGTSQIKVALFDTDGNVVTSASPAYSVHQPKNGWAEQEAADWWKAAIEGIRSVVSAVDAADIAAVGLGGQMHGLVLLDAAGEPLRRSIIWCDQRTARECEEITELVGAQRLLEITANPALTGFTASKIRWVQKHEPEIYQKCAHILLPKDYIRYKLTGEFATDVSDASGMQLLDVKNRCWSDEVLEKLGIDKALMARVYESPEITGEISAAAAELTGLRSGTPSLRARVTMRPRRLARGVCATDARLRRLERVASSTHIRPRWRSTRTGVYIRFAVLYRARGM